MLKTFTKGEKKITEGFKNGEIPVYYGNREEFSENDDDVDYDDDKEQEKQEEQEEQ